MINNTLYREEKFTLGFISLFLYFFLCLIKEKVGHITRAVEYIVEFSQINTKYCNYASMHIRVLWGSLYANYYLKYYLFQCFCGGKTFCKHAKLNVLQTRHIFSFSSSGRFQKQRYCQGGGGGVGYESNTLITPIEGFITLIG